MASNTRSIDTTIFRDNTNCFGRGAYGSVYKISSYQDHQRCAAKFLNNGRLTYPKSPTTLQEFRTKILNIRDDNLVRYIGCEMQSDEVVLIMEQELESLTTLLQRSQDPLPYHIQIDLCHDVAKGLAHLHSMGVIHKHLSSNNVVISVDGRAKITDFAVSILIGQSRPLRDERTEVYMPPEFFHNFRECSKKWDTFSFGMLAIQICTRRYPDHKVRTDHDYPVVHGKVEVPEGKSKDVLTDILRSINNLELADPTKKIQSIAVKCITNQYDEERPSEQVATELSRCKDDEHYHMSVKEVENNTTQYLEDKICIEAPTRIIDPENEDNKIEVSRGNSIVIGPKAFFRTGLSMCSYNTQTKEWQKLPDCIHRFCSLAVLKNRLTAIGGEDVEGEKVTNELFSLVGWEWEKKFKPMPTKRSYSMSVCTSDHLVVAGGRLKARLSVSNTLDFTTRLVEIMELESLTWTILGDMLPSPLSHASVTVCGNKVYMLGGENSTGKTKEVFACNVTDLTTKRADAWHSIEPVPLFSATCETVCTGTLIAVGGTEDETGENFNENKNIIYQYIPDKNTWEAVDEFKTPRCYCHVAAIPGAFQDVLIIAGGDTHWLSPSDVVEIVIVRKWM